MKITYQKEGTAPKHSLRKLQRFNLTLWKILRFVFVLFILSYGVFTFVSTKKSPDPQFLPEFTPEEILTHTHIESASLHLQNHKAPSIGFALIGQFIRNRESLQTITYEDQEIQIVFSLTFSDLSPEALREEKEALDATNLFSSIKTRYAVTEQEITLVSNPAIFLYSRTLIQN